MTVSPRPYRRYRRLAAVLAAAAVLLVAGTVARVLIHPREKAGGPAVGNGQNWGYAAAWVAQQVSRSVRITCDQLMCAQLRWEQVPAGDLRQLAPGPGAVLRTAVIVATPDVRKQLGNRLSTVVAPGMIARFGSGSTAIEVRVVAPAGASFQSLLAADVAARKADSVTLLTSNGQIVVSAKARTELAAGQVDTRLLFLLAALGGQQPVQILSFGDPSPGAGFAVSPLRSFELAQPAASHMANAAYIRFIRGFIRVQHGEFQTSSISAVRLRSGRTALRVTFPTPSWLGLLSNRAPSIRIFG